MSTTEIKTPLEFLLWFRPGGKWQLHSIIPDGKITTRTFADTAPERRALTVWVDRRQGKQNLYFSVNALRHDAPPEIKPKRKHMECMDWFHVDVDPMKGKDLETERTRLRKLIKAHARPPSLLIDSGGGFQLYYRLAEAIPAPLGAETKEGEEAKEIWAPVETYNRQLELLLSPVTGCFDVCRIMRLPFTTNLPNKTKLAEGRDKDGAPATVVAYNDETHPTSAFSPADVPDTRPSAPALGPEDTGFDLSTLDDGLLAKIADPGEPNKSAHIVGVAIALLQEGASRTFIENLLQDESHKCSAHCLKPDVDGVRAAGRAVDEATKIIGSQREKNAAIFKFAKGAVVDEHYSSTVANMLPGTKLSAQKKEALVERVRSRSKESKVSVKALFNKNLPKSRKPTEFLEAYVYVQKMKMYLHRESLHEYDNEQFDKAHAARWPIRTKGRATASTVFINSGGRQVYTPTYRPGCEEFIDGEYNLWRNTGIEPTYGDVTPWLDHAEWLIPDKQVRETILNRMAFDMQHPDQKANWGVFLGGAQGIGKGLFLQPLIAGLGQSNCRTITPDMLQSQYGDWVQARKIVFIDEMMAFKKDDLNNILKPKLAAPPFEFFINKKYGGTFDLPNILSMYFGSNREDAMKVEESDRRLFIYWSDVEHQDEAYYMKLWDWFGTEKSGYTDNHMSDVVGWLAKRDLSNFNAKGHAPMTDFKKKVIADSRDGLEVFLQEALDAGTWPLQEDLLSTNLLLTRSFPAGVGKVTPVALAKALTKIGGWRQEPRLTLADGTNPTVWVLRNRVEYETLSQDQQKALIKAALERWSRDNSPF